LIINDNCGLSEEEQENLDEEISPEYFVWTCCGYPAEHEGCREDDHVAQRGRMY